jgi:exonuclease III
MLMDQYILVWNVRGLNARSHRATVHDLVASEHASLICLETKLDIISNNVVMELLGQGFSYVYLPAVHTHGGILVAWRRDCWAMHSSSVHTFSVSVGLSQEGVDQQWWLTSVYGPSTDEDKPAFLAKLHSLKDIRGGPWMLCGDLNWVYRAEDKNNGCLNRRRMGQFRRFLREAALKEVHLHGRLYTWSN